MHEAYFNVHNNFRVNNYLWNTDKMIRAAIKSNRCYEILCTVKIGLTSRIYYKVLYSDGIEQHSTRCLTKLAHFILCVNRNIGGVLADHSVWRKLSCKIIMNM